MNKKKMEEEINWQGICHFDIRNWGSSFFDYLNLIFTLRVCGKCIEGFDPNKVPQRVPQPAAALVSFSII
jgi:hypothetical protein